MNFPTPQNRMRAQDVGFQNSPAIKRVRAYDMGFPRSLTCG